MFVFLAAEIFYCEKTDCKTSKAESCNTEMPKFSLVGSSSKKLRSWQLEVIAVVQINEVFVTNCIVPL